MFLYRRELSTDQVNKPVNTEALTKWVGHIPPDVIHDMDSIAPMLRRLGYDPDSNNPSYGKPDEMVAKQSAELNLQNKFDRNGKNYRDKKLRQKWEFLGNFISYFYFLGDTTPDSQGISALSQLFHWYMHLY